MELYREINKTHPYCPWSHPNRHHNSNSQQNPIIMSLCLYERWETLVYRYLVIICCSSQKKNNNNNNLWFDNRSQIHLFACWRSSTNHVTINFRKYLFHTYNTHSPLLHKNHHDPKNYVCVIIFLKTIEFFL